MQQVFVSSFYPSFTNVVCTAIILSLFIVERIQFGSIDFRHIANRMSRKLGQGVLPNKLRLDRHTRQLITINRNPGFFRIAKHITQWHRRKWHTVSSQSIGKLLSLVIGQVD